MRRVLYVMCHMSGVILQMLHVTCHLSHGTNSNSHGPSLYQLPHYAKQEGLQRPIKKGLQKSNNKLFPRSNLDPFWAKISNGKTTVFTIYFPQ